MQEAVDPAVKTVRTVHSDTQRKRLWNGHRLQCLSPAIQVTVECNHVNLWNVHSTVTYVAEDKHWQEDYKEICKREFKLRSISRLAHTLTCERSATDESLTDLESQ